MFVYFKLILRKYNLIVHFKQINFKNIVSFSTNEYFVNFDLKMSLFINKIQTVSIQSFIF